MDLLVRVNVDTSQFSSGIDAVKQALAGLEASTASAHTFVNAIQQTTDAVNSTADELTKATIEAQSLGGALVVVGKDNQLSALSEAASSLSSELKAAAENAKTVDLSLQGMTKAGVPIYGAPGASSPTGDTPDARKKKRDDIEALRDSASKAAHSLSALNSVQGMLSGSITGTASAAIGLTGALTGLKVAHGGYIAIVVAASVAITKFALDSFASAERMKAAIKFDNASSGIDNLRQSYERLSETMDRATSLARELRGVTSQGKDLDFEKKKAEMQLRQKQELAALNTSDVDGAQKLKSKHAVELALLESDRSASTVGSEFSSSKKELTENQAAIALRKSKLSDLDSSAANATRSASYYASQATGFGQNKAFNLAESKRYNDQARGANEEAKRVRSEIEELEKKNTVLEAQTALYEKRNAIVQIQRAAAAIPEPEFAKTEAIKSEKDKGPKIVADKSVLSFDSDRLARIGGYNSPGSGSSRLESLGEKQLAEQVRTRQAIEKSTSAKTVAVWGT